MLREDQIAVLDKNTDDLAELERLVNEEHAEGLYHDFKLVGAVKRAHDVDVNLSATLCWKIWSPRLPAFWRCSI